VSASGTPGGTESPDPDLTRVAAAWAALPEAVRRGIVAMVEGVGEADCVPRGGLFEICDDIRPGREYHR